ncbi:MAG: hypothetical protein FJZ16_03660 [Candidatus Omnitrophica bacterium]|nr:hypothetical protein [Candidatus Omnitrophota bacterium]
MDRIVISLASESSCQYKQHNSLRSLLVLGAFGLPSPTSTPIPLVPSLRGIGRTILVGLKGLVVKLITEKPRLINLLLMLLMLAPRIGCLLQDIIQKTRSQGTL